MELQELCAALRATLSANRDEMKHAEAVLKQHETTAGHVSNLFRVAVEESVDIQVRLSAAIALKRIVERAWDPEEDMPKIAEEDKAQIRHNLVEAVVRGTGPIQSQLVEVMKVAVYADFPEAWPELNVSVVQSLHAHDERQILGALLALRCIARKFEFKTDVKQEHFDELMQASLPKVLEILRTCALNEEHQDIYAEVIRAILKFFWSVTFAKFPAALEESHNFDHFMQSLLVLVKKDLPWNLLPADEAEQESWIWWKAKKWVLHLTTRFFKYYGSVDKASGNEKGKKLAEIFTAHVSIPMLEAHIELLAKLTQVPVTNERVLAQLVNYMEHGTSISQTYKVLKDHLKPMLINIVFPLLCFNEKDARLMAEDPEEYIRKSHDFIEDVFGVKAAAGNFTLNVCRTRRKLLLQDFTSHLLSMLHQYKEARNSGQEPVEIARRMDGALTAFGTLEPILSKKKAYRASVEDLLIEYVLPCFQSRFAHLRSRACWVSSKYSAAKFSGDSGAGPTFQRLLQSVVLAMKDPELLVRVDAVVALKYFVDAMENLDEFKFILKDLLNVFFTLMNEVDNEDVVFTLESIVEKLGEDIAPFAEDLGLNLVAAFRKCVGTGEEDDDVESLCAFGCIRAMNTLIESVRKSPSLFGALEEIFYPVIDAILLKENMELIEDVLDMITYFTYFGAEISPRMWGLMPRLHSAYMAWAFDYFENLATCFENYIIKGKATFLLSKDPDYMGLFNQVLEHAMTGDVQEVEFHPALKLMGTAMQHLKGEIDNFVGPYLHLTLEKWKTAERSDTKVLLVNVVANAMWYNPVQAVGYFRQQGVLAEVFAKWLEMIYTEKESGRMKYFLKHSDKKISILGLISFLALPNDQFPTDIVPAQILGGVMKLLMAVRRQEEEMPDSSDEEDYEPDIDSEEDIDDDGGDGRDDDDESGVESNASSAYNKLLEKETRKLLLGYQDSDSDDYGESDMSSDDEDAPIYAVDPFVTFSDAMGYLHTTHSERLTGMMGALDDAGRMALHQMVEYGRQKKAEAANGIAQQMNGN